MKIINIFPQLTRNYEVKEKKSIHKLIIIIILWLIFITNLLVVYFFFKDEFIFVFLYLFTKSGFDYNVSKFEEKINNILNTDLVCVPTLDNYRIETSDGLKILSNNKEIIFKTLDNCESILNGNFKI